MTTQANNMLAAIEYHSQFSGGKWYRRISSLSFKANSWTRPRLVVISGQPGMRYVRKSISFMSNTVTKSHRRAQIIVNISPTYLDRNIDTEEFTTV